MSAKNFFESLLSEAKMQSTTNITQEIKSLLRLADGISSVSRGPRPYRESPFLELKRFANLSDNYDEALQIERKEERKVLSDEERKARAKRALVRRIRDGETPTIRQQDHAEYDELEENEENVCNLNEEKSDSKYGDYINTYEYTSDYIETNLGLYMECVRDLAEVRVTNFVNRRGPTKFFYAYAITFENSNGTRVRGQFTSNVDRINNIAEVHQAFINAEHKIWDDIDVFNAGGSGKRIVNINISYVNMGMYNPVANAGRSYIELPDDMKKMRCLINIKNEDNECFAWTVLARLHQAGKNPNMISNYKRYYDELKFPTNYDAKVGMPPHGTQLDKFEELNNVAISIYTRISKKKGCAPYRISKRQVESGRRISMLLLEDESGETSNKHYVLIKNLDTFLAKPGRQMYHCNLCMTGFTSELLRDKHMKGRPCITLGDQATKILLPDSGTIIEYCNDTEEKKNTEWKEHRFPIVVYADTESLLIKPNETSTVMKIFNDVGISDKKIIDIIIEYADIIHCDTKSGDTVKYQHHKMSSFCYHIVFTDECKTMFRPKTFTYRGEDAAKKMLECLRKDCGFYISKLKWTKEVSQNPEDGGEQKKSINEVFKNIPRRAIKVPIFLHNLSGYDAHPILLEMAQTCKKASCIPRTGEKFVSFEADGMVFKDSISFLSSSLDNLAKNLLQKCPQDLLDTKDTTAISEYETRGFRETRKYYKELKHAKDYYYKEKTGDEQDFYAGMKNPYNYSYSRIRMLTEKGKYPYEHFDSFDRFKETTIPEAKVFISTLDKCVIDGVDYEDKKDDEDIMVECKKAYNKAVSVFNEFKCKNLGDYSDLYLKTDTLILADIFESFRDTCLREFKLDPVNYYTLPGYSWDCCLKKSQVKLEPFVEGQLDMLLFVESCIRGGISMIPNRYGKAENSYTRARLNDYEYKKSEECRQNDTYLLYYDANALYASAMCQYLPYGGYSWEDKDNFRQVLKDIKSGKIGEESNIGYMLEVDIRYPEELHNSHNDYPCAPEPLVIDNYMLSPYSIKLKYDIAKLQKGRREHKLGQSKSTSTNDPEDFYDKVTIDNNKVPKLVCRLTDKKNYVVHYRTLKVYMDLGLKVTKIHKILSFKQSPWMKTFIEANITLRKASKNEFEKGLYKLFNNAVFGKTMENVRKRKQVELIIDKDILKKRLNSIKHGTWEEIKGGLIIMNVHKETMLMNKPIIVGASILDISKTTMYNFHYNVIKAKYGDSAKLLFTDTDSLCYEITISKGGDIYKDIYEDKKFMSKLDTSAYKDCKDGWRKAVYDDPVYGGLKTKGCIGLFKDVMADDGYQMATEFVGLRAKMYSLKMLDDKTEKSTAKGVKTKAKKHIKHEKYKSCLFGYKLEDRCQMIKFNVIRSHKHQLYSEQISKVSLCASDDKFYQLSDTTKYAYGHYMIDLIENL